MKNYGIQLYSLRDISKDDFEGMLKAVADMGYKMVESAGFFGHSAEEVRAMLDEYGFTGRCVINSWNGKLNEYVHEKHGRKYLQHVYYPEEYLGECTVDPYSYAHCACLFTNNPEGYDYLRSRGVEPWVGAGVKDEETLDKAIANGACAVTCNNPDEILALLRKKGLHK